MHVVYGANLDLDPLDPGQPRRQYGTAILSDFPILESGNTLLPKIGRNEQRGLLQALLNVRGVPLRVFNTHLQHNSQPERQAQATQRRRGSPDGGGAEHGRQRPPARGGRPRAARRPGRHQGRAAHGALMPMRVNRFGWLLRQRG